MSLLIINIYAGIIRQHYLCYNHEHGTRLITHYFFYWLSIRFPTAVKIIFLNVNPLIVSVVLSTFAYFYLYFIVLFEVVWRFGLYCSNDLLIGARSKRYYKEMVYKKCVIPMLMKRCTLFIFIYSICNQVGHNQIIWTDIVEKINKFIHQLPSCS